MKRFYYLGEEVFPYGVVSNKVYVEGKDNPIDIKWLKMEDDNIATFKDLVEYLK